MRAIVATSREVIAIGNGEHKTLQAGKGPYYGITRANDMIYVAARNQHNAKYETTLEVFEDDLTQFATVGVEDVSNVHQIDSHKGEIYLANTDRNRIESLGFTNSHNIVWSDKSGDYNHVNSVLTTEDGVYVCEHNHGKGLESGKASSVKFVTYKGKVLKDIHVGYGIHSLLKEDNFLYVCDSYDMNLARIDLDTHEVVYIPVKLDERWYLRGLAKMGDDFMIGLSWLGERSERHGVVQGGIAIVDYEGNVKDIIHFRDKGQVNEIRMLDG
jgi:DNA-binding beta-propeller fold protein YncE